MGDVIPYLVEICKSLPQPRLVIWWKECPRKLYGLPAVQLRIRFAKSLGVAKSSVNEQPYLFLNKDVSFEEDQFWILPVWKFGQKTLECFKLTLRWLSHMFVRNMFL
jgi:hypothetical protein